MRKVKEFCNTKRKEVSIEEKNIIVMKDSFWMDIYFFFRQHFSKNQVVLKKKGFWEQNDPALSSSYSKKIS